MNIRSPNGQKGAALVVGLVLLLVLTLLAISGVNSASLEFFMAGNEQYRQNAFQTAEEGIEAAMGNLTLFNPTGTQSPPTVAQGNESFTISVAPQLGGNPTITTDASSATNFSTFYFEINSIATSTRNTRATNVQGARYTVNSSYAFPPISPGNTAFN